MQDWDDTTIARRARCYGADPSTRAVVGVSPGAPVCAIGSGTGASVRRAPAAGTRQAVGMVLPRMIGPAGAGARVRPDVRAAALPLGGAGFGVDLTAPGIVGIGSRDIPGLVPAVGRKRGRA